MGVCSAGSLPCSNDKLMRDGICMAKRFTANTFVRSPQFFLHARSPFSEGSAILYAMLLNVPDQVSKPQKSSTIS